jgi:hypothetical protein
MRLGKIIKFLYSLFIGIQLIFLGYAEGLRIKGIVRLILANARKIRIKSGVNPRPLSRISSDL